MAGKQPHEPRRKQRVGRKGSPRERDVLKKGTKMWEVFAGFKKRNIRFINRMISQYPSLLVASELWRLRNTNVFREAQTNPETNKELCRQLQANFEAIAAEQERTGLNIGTIWMSATKNGKSAALNMNRLIKKI